MSKVKDICKEALEDVDEEKLQIQVDKIDKESFKKLSELVDENLVKTKPAQKRQKTDWFFCLPIKKFVGI